MSNHGAERILIERDRQTKLFYSSYHDSQWIGGELIDAAIFHLKPDSSSWPWECEDGWEDKIRNRSSKHVSGRIKNLIKAGALVAAEIDRLVAYEVEIE